MEKLCPKCNLVKSVDEFAKNKNRYDGLQVQCRACKKLTDATHYRNNKPAQLKRNTANRQKMRKLISEYKELKGCLYCDEADACCLDFHHKEGEHKIKEVSQMLYTFSQSMVFKEVEKCDVVCANCHRKLHAGKICLLTGVSK